LEKILFNNNGISPEINNKKELKIFLIRIFSLEKIKFKQVSYIFCKDDYLLSLNKRHLNHDTFTDIITFTLSTEKSPIISEIYISVERVKENAALLKIAYKNELLRVMIHGILHLCGYSDHTPSEKSTMRKKEDFYIKLAGFT
jgi:rRNA maturation RNase YbeY